MTEDREKLLLDAAKARLLNFHEQQKHGKPFLETPLAASLMTVLLSALASKAFAKGEQGARPESRGQGPSWAVVVNDGRDGPEEWRVYMAADELRRYPLGKRFGTIREAESFAFLLTDIINEYPKSFDQTQAARERLGTKGPTCSECGTACGAGPGYASSCRMTEH